MAVTGGFVKMIVRYVYLGQNCENVGWYIPSGSGLADVGMTEICMAYWEQVRDFWAAIAFADATINSLNSILGYEIGGGLGYAEVAVPELDRQGAKSTETYGEPLPGTLAGAVRLTVGSVVTRPGQKRAPFIGEAQISGNDLDVTYLTQLADWGKTYSTDQFLGGDAPDITLSPVVVRLGADGSVITHQLVTGQFVNPYASSQVSRKRGHGS